MADDQKPADAGQTPSGGDSPPKVPAPSAENPAPEISKPPTGRRGRPSKARGAPHSKDDAADRWTVRGVPPVVRALAVSSAESRNMTVGDWVAEAIRAYSRADNGKVSADTEAKLPVVPLPKEVREQLDALNTRLTKLEQAPQPGIFARLFGRRSNSI